MGQQRALIVPLVCILYPQTWNCVRPVVPVPLQTLEPVLEHQRVLIVPLGCFLYPQTWNRVRPVPPLSTPPLSNATLVRIKQLQRAMLDIMEILVMHLAKRVVPVPLRILEQVLGQQRVRIALLGSTR